MRTTPTLRSQLVTAVLVAAASAAGVAQSGRPEWPGLWGPARQAAAEPGSMRQPRAFRPLWRRPVTGGYSEVVSANGRVFTLEARDGADQVVALDGRTGREHWRVRLGPTYRGHDGSHDGPISTPAVDGSDLYAIGPHGVLVAIDAVSGAERWRHDLVQGFRARPPIYGFGVSPLIEGSLVIVPTGGEGSQGLLAFERATGRLAWSAPVARGLSYASAVPATLAGTRQVIAAAGDRIVAVSPADGRELWSAPGPGLREELGNSPRVLPDDRVLLTFWGEAVMLKISSRDGVMSATELWRSPRLRSAYGPTAYRDGYLYGFGGDVLLCVDAATGEVRWRERTDHGSLIALGSSLLMLGRNSGELRVINPSPSGYTEIARTPVLTAGAVSFTGPSAADGRVYVRNLDEIVALQIER